MARKVRASVYDDFVRRHYVRHPLRGRGHVRAVLEAAGLRDREVNGQFWERISPEWVWAVSSTPFPGDGARRANARYRRYCREEGVTP